MNFQTCDGRCSDNSQWSIRPKSRCASSFFKRVLRFGFYCWRRAHGRRSDIDLLSAEERLAVTAAAAARWHTHFQQYITRRLAFWWWTPPLCFLCRTDDENELCTKSVFFLAAENNLFLPLTREHAMLEKRSSAWKRMLACIEGVAKLDFLSQYGADWDANKINASNGEFPNVRSKLAIAELHVFFYELHVSTTESTFYWFMLVNQLTLVEKASRQPKSFSPFPSGHKVQDWLAFQWHALNSAEVKCHHQINHRTQRVEKVYVYKCANKQSQKSE